MEIPVSSSTPQLSFAGRFLRIAKIEGEFFVDFDDPYPVVENLRRSKKADIFSFIRPTGGKSTEYQYPYESDSIAVVCLSTYDHWWTKQINDKTRNMVRKAKKAGVEIRRVQFDDELIKGIKRIYDEVKVKQGKPNKHYGKSLETLKLEHSSFLDRSEFTGAFLLGELIGFSKVTFTKNRGVLMNIAGFNSHRDKAPSNALLAKAVESCAERSIPYLQYGVWSKRGLGNFKKHHAFERLDIPRYFVPLSVKGRIALALKLHRSFKEYIPESVMDLGIELRSRWQSYKVRKQSPTAMGL
jgi:hypothetical protein